MYIYFTYTS